MSILLSGETGHPASRREGDALSRLRLINPTAAASVAFAAAAGGALMLSHPPTRWWWLTFLHVPLLLIALMLDRSQRPRARGALLGMIAGAACYGPLLSWLIAPAGWIGWFLLVAVQIAWMAFFGVLMVRYLDSFLLPLIAAVAMTGLDAWRSIWPMNGFEWGAIAYAHVDDSWLLPVARVLGGRGITFLVVLISVAALVVLRGLVDYQRGAAANTPEDLVRSQRVPLATLAIGVLMGAMLVSDAPPERDRVDVLLVQGHDVRFWEQPEPRLFETVTAAMHELTLEALADQPPPDVVVWPESSIDRDPESTIGQALLPFVDQAAAAAPELIAGTTLDGPDPARNRYVAASHYRDGFNEVDRYVKRRLVPFGEYVPMRRWLDWFPPLEQIPRDALAGSEPGVMELRDGSRFAVVICFETLFTSLVRDNVLGDGQPAQAILTLTNDASFRETAEPDQHLAQSQLRAIETGRWVVHGAISGSSAFVDPHGVIHDATPLFTQTTIRRSIGLVDDLTPYLRVGDIVGVFTRIGVLGLVAVGFASRRQRQAVAGLSETSVRVG
ncbi:MAG: apolipoprotein N-acyltransferase [Nitriliruptoraceae bacterium]